MSIMTDTWKGLKEYSNLLLSNDPNTPSINKFVYLLSGVMANFAVWGTWVWLNVAHFINTARDEVLTMINIPEGVYWTYAIAMGVPLIGKVGQTIFTQRNQPQGQTVVTVAPTTGPATTKPPIPPPKVVFKTKGKEDEE